VRIALELTAAARQSAGIGRYTRELAAALVARGHQEYVPFVADRLTRPAAEALTAGITPATAAPLRLRSTGVPARLEAILWQRLRLPIPVELWTGPIDLYHATDFLAPPRRRARAVITIHDLSFLRHPERAEPGLRRYLAAAVPRAVRQAAHLLADSENTRRDLIALLGVPEERVTVAYPGVGPAFRRVDDPEALERVRRRHGLDGPFVLGVGTLEPRKDWPVLMEAFLRLHPAWPAHRLAIAGGSGWLTGEILAAAARAGEGVRLLGFVADEDLPALYSLADAFAYPSIYEGFGLPPLEALACGVPTVVTAAACLPEVVGDAALTVPPGDAAALAAALARLLGEPALRAELAARGPARAAHFTWDGCAEAVEAVYARLEPGGESSR
jgi:glycosyltransferase involved in cell wall biosynthesis